MLVVRNLLEQHGPDALRHPAVDLSVNQHGVDHATAILDHDIFENPQIARVAIDFHLGHVGGI